MVEQKKPSPDPTQRVIVCSMNHTLLLETLELNISEGAPILFPTE